MNSRDGRTEAKPTSMVTAGPAAVLPAVDIATCPLRASIGPLGRKWALLILRDVAFLKMDRFNQILHNNDGLTPRVLSRRLQELVAEGLLERIEGPNGTIRYSLTPRGQDALPVLRALIAFGIKHHADQVFADQEPRSMEEVFPHMINATTPV